MTLRNVIESLDSLNENSTIYAANPWTESSEVMVAQEPEAGGVPGEAAQLGLKYFLEVFIARDFVNDWIASLETPPSLDETCKRLIRYATHDA